MTAEITVPIVDLLRMEYTQCCNSERWGAEASATLLGEGAARAAIGGLIQSTQEVSHTDAALQPVEPSIDGECQGHGWEKNGQKRLRLSKTES